MTGRAWEHLTNGRIVWLPSIRWFTRAFLAIGRPVWYGHKMRTLHSQARKA